MTPSRSTNDQGEVLVWDIFENAWVTLSYWHWVNGSLRDARTDRTK